MNTPPIVTVEDLVVLLGDSINGVNLANASDPDADPITKWRFLDTFGGATSGHFKLSGVKQAANTWIEVADGDLGTLEYHAGTTIANEGVWVQVFDGTDWSTIGKFLIYSALPNVNLPVVNASIFNVVAYEKILVSDFVSAFDPDGWPIDRWKFKDRNTSVSSGYFEFKGVKKDSNVWFYVKAEDLDQLYYVGALFGQTEKVDIRARDGALWSQRATVDAITAHNANRPIVIPSSHVLPMNTLVPIETLFDWSDEDGNTAKLFRFIDTSPGADSGFITRNGIVQPTQTWIEIAADQLGTVGFTSAKTFMTDNIRVRVFDGKHWSSIQTIQVMADVQPKLGTPNMTFIEDLLQTIPVTDVFSKTDVGPQYTKYQIYDATATSPINALDLSGRLRNGNQILDALKIHEFSASEFESRIRVQGGKWEVRSLDEYYIRAFNGKFWSPWERAIVRTEPEMLDGLSFPGFTEDRPLSLLDFFNPPHPITIYYSFMNVFPNDGRGTGSANDQNFVIIDSAARQAIRQQIARFEDMQTALHFEEVPQSFVDPEFGTLGGYMSIGAYNDPDDTACAFAFTPNDPTDPTSGDIWLNYGLCGIGAGGINWADEEFDRMVFTHEFGHVLGLKHPYPEPGNIPIFSPEGGFHDYSVMYTPGDRLDNLYPRRFGLADHAWLQNIYGKNPNQNAGDTLYDFAGYWQGDLEVVDAISDGGGIDTLDVSASPYEDFIDLSEGGYSMVGNPNNFNRENIWIAFGTVIENVITGVGDNTIHANQAVNTINAGFGNDEIWSYGGNDLMIGAWGNDIFHWELGDGHDTIDDQQLGGRDRIVVGDLSDFGLNDFTQDLQFRKLGRDLVIDFAFDGGLSQGSVTIKDQLWGGSRIETLEILGFDVDLEDLFNKLTDVNQKFAVNFVDPPSTFGQLVIPV